MLPAPAVKGIASGLLMMAFFTIIWSAIAWQGLSGSGYQWLLLTFTAFCIGFAYYAIKVFRVVKHAPEPDSPEDIAREKNSGKWFGIIFGAEGLGIFIAINIVINLGHPELTIPVIALVVGLHFYPLAKVFRRTIDYYLATWSTLVAVLAIILTLNKTLNESSTLAFTGIGLAIATTCYGLYMVLSARPVLKFAAGIE